MTIDMKQVREAAGRRAKYGQLVAKCDSDQLSFAEFVAEISDIYGISPPSHRRAENRYIADSLLLADFACHVLSTSVVVPRELHEEVLMHLEAYGRELGEVWSEELDAEVNGLEDTIDRLSKLGQSQ